LTGSMHVYSRADVSFYLSTWVNAGAGRNVVVHCDTGYRARKSTWPSSPVSPSFQAETRCLTREMSFVLVHYVELIGFSVSCDSSLKLSYVAKCFIFRICWSHNYVFIFLLPKYHANFTMLIENCNK